MDISLPPPDRPTLRERIAGKIHRTLFGSPPPRRWPAMPYPTVNLNYWTMEGKVNFGDELSRTIVELMLARQGRTVFDCVSSERKLLAIGSVLHDAEENTVVWGTGLHGGVAAEYHFYKHLDVRAVRGPLTRKFLMQKGIDVPEIYGDPALLLPMLTGDRFASQQRTNPIGFVMHLNDIAHLDQTTFLGEEKNINIIDPLRSWDVVVHDILKNEFVISSSLHGIIIAETFGIPARYLRLSEREPILKYFDYYYSTGRDLNPARTIREAIDMGGEPISVPDITKLMSAFPYDIWES